MRYVTAAAVLLVIFNLTAGPLIAQDTTEGTANQPSFFVEQQRIDLGTVKAGEDAVATFVFRNTGDVPVKILKAKPS
jgi:hypothetical protein